MRRLTTLFSSEFLGYSPPPLLERLIEDAQKTHKQRSLYPALMG